MKRKNFFHIALAIGVLLLVSLACGSSNEGTVITPAAQEADQAQAPAADDAGSGDTQQEESESAFKVFEVGDLIEVKEHTIRLNSVEYQGTVLVANYTFENYGSSDINVSSMLSFSAKKGDGTKLEQEYFDCGSSSLDGSALPGDKLRGDICWSGASPNDEIKIYYESSLFGQGAVVWNAIEGVAEELNTDSGTLPQMKVFQVGDLVQGQDHTIILNTIAFQGNVLKANFTLENQGSSDLVVSSMLSFYARKSDGSALDQEYFDCGTSIDGSVIPGDKVRGDICWSGANPDDGIKIYYESGLFSSGAIVWPAE